MCLTCGCHLPTNHHHDPRHIVLAQLIAAAQAAGISPEQAAFNVPDTLEYALGNPARAFATAYGLPTLVFDLDDTLAFTSEGMMIALNAAFDESYRNSDIGVDDWTLFLPKKQRKWLYDQRSQPDLYENLTPNWRAVDVALLAKRLGYPVWVCTERAPALHQVTANWLEQWHVPADGMATVGLGNKPAWMRRFSEQNPAILVDDKHVFEHLIPAPGVQMWTVPGRAQPPGVPPPGVVRLGSWQQARDLLIELLDTPLDMTGS